MPAIRPRLIPLAVALLASVAALPLAAQERLSQPSYRVRVESNVMVPMRDGVRLATDIYRPDAPGRFPVILERTPYNKTLRLGGGNVRYYYERGTYWASRGYVFAVQDARGRHDSEGEWEPFFHEAEDGYDAQQWAGGQPWSSGKVCTIGGSYGGWTQWFPAPLGNPHLACMVPYVAPPNPFKNFPYENGALLLLAAQWMFMMDGRTNQLFGEDITQVYGNVPERAYNWSAIHTQLPLSQMDERAGRQVAWWKQWLEHNTFDAYWKRLDYQAQFNRIDVPVFHISGWYDGDLIGTMMNFPGMVRGAKSARARRSQKMIIGPWPHGVNQVRRLGEAYFGEGSLIDLDREVLRWYDYWLKGMDTGVQREAPVRIFVMGANQWRDEWEWPLARTRWTRYYLSSGGRANSLFGDGTLATTPPGNEPPDRYTYNPDKPTPSVLGPADLREVHKRMDVLVFQTPPLEEDLEVTGPITLKLYAASSAPDTDFYARLSDVAPDGRALNLCQGVIRARFRTSLQQPTLLEPGQVYEYTIDIWPTSNLFRRGHRIRLDITSSNFPLFDRNLNTGQNNGTSTEMRVAEQTIYHDAARPSHLSLPLIPARARAAGGGQ